MKSAEAGAGVETGRKLDYRQTAEMTASLFAWKPGPVSALFVRALSRVTRPLEQGSYTGRSLAGEPHRAAWVIASPLTVFVLAEPGRRRKLYLAARLRSTGAINIIQEAPDGRPGRPRRRRASAIFGPIRLALRRRADADRGTTPRLSGRPPAAGRDFDLGALITIQRESDVSLTVVPVVRAHHQHPPDGPAASLAARASRFSPLRLFRKTTNWARTARTAAVKNCRPMVLSRWLEENQGEDLAGQIAALRADLSANVESERRACAGPPLVPKWEVKRQVLADPVLHAYMQEYALREGLTREAVIEEARGHLEEIASDYRAGVVRYFARAVDYAFDRLLDGLEVDREGIRFLSECDSRSRVVLVCSHKSYVDPLLIGYTLYRSGLVPPQQAAGLNLNIFFVGWLLRHSGAFYLRRTFSGETLYREVFRAYVRHLLAENYTSVVYIEGTRSRDGKLQRPKTGYLAILADALRMGVCPDITLVPVYLGYDKVPEETAHVREMAGGRKISESVRGFAGMYKSINTRLGRAFVKFGAPMSMKALLAEYGLQGAAEAACDGIEAVTPVTARSLAACSLLATGKQLVSRDEFEETARALLTFSERRRLPLAVNADIVGIRAAVDWFAVEGHVAVEGEGDAESFRLAGPGRRFLEYNKNVPLGHYLEPALSALAARAAGEGGAAGELAFLRELFSREFLFRPSARDEAWRLDYTSCAAALASMLESFLESYLVACRSVCGLGPEGIELDEAVERCFEEGGRMLASGEIHREEALSRVAFKNAFRGFREMGLVSERRGTEGDREKVRLVDGPAAGDRGEVERRIRSFL